MFYPMPYSQSESKKTVAYSAVCNGWYFPQNPGDARGLFIFPPKTKQITTATTFHFTKNTRCIFKQHRKNPSFNYHSDFYGVKVKKVTQKEIKMPTTDKEAKERNSREHQIQTS